jgi:predicted phosphodiesterase
MSNRVLILGDLHAGVHDRRLWDITLDVIETTKPKVVLQIGDFGDWESLSSHARKWGTRRSYSADKKAVRAKVADLQLATDYGARLIILQGNHDERLERYLAERAPEMEDDEDFDSRSVFQLRAEDEWVPYRSGIHIGKVYYAHDIGHAGVSATRQNLLSAGQCIVTGHSHRAGIEYGGSILGEHIFSMSVGYMGDRNEFAKKPYLPIAKMRDWQNGLATVDYDKKWNLGFASFAPYVKSRLVLDEKEYR